MPSFPTGSPAYVPNTPRQWVQLDGQLVLYVANGSGKSYALTEGLGNALLWTKMPAAVKTINWCQRPRVTQDHADHFNQLGAAQAMAHEIMALRAHSPGVRVVILAHSSGNRVALAAGEMLPPGSLERIVLLAPSVNSYYDVRRALVSTRKGIDSFHSPYDGILDFCGETMGSADGVRTSIAGVTGFVLPRYLNDTLSFRGLRQHEWRQDMGTPGTHYGWTDGRFLARWVVPLLSE